MSASPSPESLRHLDVTKAPYNADPTGKTDSTEAIIRALDSILERTLSDFESTLAAIAALPEDNMTLGIGCENRRQNGKIIGIFPERLPDAPTLYFPRGVYLVSDTIGYSFKNLQNSFGNELSWQIRLKGEGPGKSIIRLAESSPGFDGPTPKPVITFMRGRSSNVAMSNYVFDLGIEVGRNNPSAIGLDFFANNSGSVRRVDIRAEDGSGFAGIQVAQANYSGVLLKDVNVDGFDYGAYYDSATRSMFSASENFILKDSRKAGIYVGNVCASLRKISVQGAPMGLLCDGESAHAILIDSDLEGAGESAIQHQAGILYASNISTSGFARAWKSPLSVSEHTGDSISELVLPPNSLANPSSPTPRLSVEETPPTPIFRFPEESTGILRFGAQGNGEEDDAPAIQAALDSGLPEIVFEPGRYRLCHPVRIPASVRRLSFNFADLIAGEPLTLMKEKGAFIITEDAPEPLHIEHLLGWEAWRGEHVMFDHASQRTLVLKDLHTQTLSLYRNSVEGGKVFLENVACTAGVVPGTVGHGRACIVFKNQRVWARQLNPERGEPMVLNDGGSLWVMGFKTEDEGICFHTINGGRSEILGGILNGGRSHATAFVSEDSAIRISAASNGWNPESYFGTVVKEAREGTSTIVTYQDCQSRHFPEKRGPQFSLPLYVSPAL